MNSCSLSSETDLLVTRSWYIQFLNRSKFIEFIVLPHCVFEDFKLINKQLCNIDQQTKQIMFTLKYSCSLIWLNRMKFNIICSYILNQAIFCICFTTRFMIEINWIYIYLYGYIHICSIQCITQYWLSVLIDLGVIIYLIRNQFTDHVQLVCWGTGYYIYVHRCESL